MGESFAQRAAEWAEERGKRLRGRKAATELRGQARSQMEFGNEEKRVSSE
jgi:hypothetical protein